MQARGRRGDRALLAREHGLVVGASRSSARALRGDIGRQRHGAELRDRLIEAGAVERKRQRDLAALALVFDRRIELAEKADPALVAEADDVARRSRLAGLDEGPPARAVDALDAASPRSAAPSPRPMRRPLAAPE